MKEEEGLDEGMDSSQDTGSDAGRGARARRETEQGEKPFCLGEKRD